MNHTLQDAAIDLVARAKRAGQSGTLMGDSEAVELYEAANGTVPLWYLELLRKVPLAGLSFECGEPDEEGYRPHSFHWNDVAGIRSESFECYPGLAILARGYFNCASCATGGGDPYFVGPEVDGLQPVYQVYHDVSDQPDSILASGLVLVAPSLEALFNAATLDG